LLERWHLYSFIDIQSVLLILLTFPDFCFSLELNTFYSLLH
jgi:hypothetical protein